MRAGVLTSCFVIGAVCLTAHASAQKPSASEAPAAPRFDVTSVKRSYIPELIQRPRLTTTPGRFTAINVTLRSIVKYAFEISHDSQLVGGADWFADARFNIQATAPGALGQAMRPMIRQLLADRFGLVVKQDRRTRPVYRLVRARVEDVLPKGLTPSPCPDAAGPEPSSCGTIGGGPFTLMGSSITMGQLAKQLSSFPYTELDRIVIDATGLIGAYRFAVQFSPTRQSYGLRADTDPNLPAFPTALQEQVGLKLEPASAPVDVWTVETATWPEGD